MSKDTRLSIGGMSCAGCVSAVEQALTEVVGVESALVNLGERTAFVSGDVNSEELINAVRKAGYDAAELRGLADESEKEELELHEYRKLWKRALIAGGIGVAMFATGMSGLLPAIPDNKILWLGISLITLLVLIFVGGHFFRGALKTVRAGRGNMDLLVALGTGTAWLYSTIIVLFPNVVPDIARHVYFEAAVIIVALVSIGSALELRARGKTSLAIKRLIGLQPDTARVIRNGKEMDIPIADVGLDETVRIRPGDRIPVDGSVFEGTTYIDESMLSGEPMPAAKHKGDVLYGGTLNTTGSILMRTTHIGRDTALAKIIGLVRKAQSSKPAIGRLVDKVAAVFVPVVVAIAIISFVIWYFVGPEPRISFAVVSAMTVLVIACPCALGLATPISIMVGISRAAEQGVLIRNGDALQRAGQLTTVVLDKTGTVTEGNPRVTGVFPVSDTDETQVLQWAASIETGSEHPLATAIVKAANAAELILESVTNFQAVSGRGVSAMLDGKQLRLGNAAFLAENEIQLNEASGSRTAAATVVYLVVDNKHVGSIHIADPVREDSTKAIRRLHEQGMQVVMLTGDTQSTAESVAQQVGIDSVIAGVLPADKAEHIKQLQSRGEVVAMVGDGINDAPALALADVGIAIGTGTDVAIESADIALMRSSLHGVADAIALSRATVRNIKQNLFGAFIYNILGIPVAAGVLYPFIGILLSPIVAAAAMSMSSVTVVSNALRLRKASL